MQIAATDLSASGFGGLLQQRRVYSNQLTGLVDAYGNETWSMDQRGFITRTQYDIPTGAVTQRIADVNTSTEPGVPTGWTTPAGGGSNLVTDFEFDAQGRPTQILGPVHSVDIGGTPTSVRRATWNVYDETGTQNVVRVGQGYATGSSPSTTYTLINPVAITITAKNGKLLEQIQATRASTAGRLTSSDTFAQASYTRWTTYQYSDCCNLISQRVYHLIPATGAGVSPTNYYQTSFGYDLLKRRNRTLSPGGTISRTVFDTRGLALSHWMGTNDSGAAPNDPAGGGAPGNNMLILTGYQYDGGSGGGNGNLTQQTDYVSSTESRITQFQYDFRNRQTITDGELDFYQVSSYDNLGHVIQVDQRNTNASGNLVARQETKFDNQGRVYQSITYGVDPATGTVGNALKSNTWYDAAGNTIKSLPAGSKLFTKSVFDSLGRQVAQYQGYDLDETSYADADTVDGDTIIEQSESVYDDASNIIERIARQRYHNAPATQTGQLKNPTTTPKARVTYSAMYPDGIGRLQASAEYGTNGGSPLSRPSTIPSRSDSVLVSSQTYDSAGQTVTTSDPSGTVTKIQYDHAGRQTTKIENYLPSSSSSSGMCQASDDANVTVRMAYNPDGNLSSLTAENSTTGDQVTQYVYGTTLSDSGVASNALLRKEIYPDSVSSSDVVLFSYNRLGQPISKSDQNGSTHNYDYDKLGRLTQDRIATLGSGVDGAVRRIATSYDVRGLTEKVSSYNNASVGSGSVVNEVQYAYNGFSQPPIEYQATSGPVHTSTTPKVQYSYANGSDNTIRPTSMTYPDGRVLTYNYGTSAGIDDSASRVAALVDDDGSTHLVDYQYLGAQQFVIADYAQPDTKWTLADLSSSNDPDTGDIYSGLDRFGRVKDNRWYDYGGSSDSDRIKYGYDRASNRIWRQNVVAGSLGQAYDELYSYDGVHRLKHMERGTLNSGHTAISGKSLAECWSLDDTGNWKKYLEDSNGNGTWDLNQSRTANQANEITDISETVGTAWPTPAHDLNGSMTSLPQPSALSASYTVTWDAWNRMVKLASGASTVAEYAYDGLNRRVVKKQYAGGTLSATRHIYMSHRWQTLEERVDSSSSADRQFVWGQRYVDDLILRDRDTNSNGTLDERLYALQDGNWNVTACIDTSGAVQQRFAYQGYGESKELNANFTSYTGTNYDWQYRYTGRELDISTGLYYYRNRYFHCQLGRFCSRDPIGYEGSEWNLYEYAESAPILFTDPMGNDIWVEGSTGTEPAGHQSLCVGNPNASYDCYGFGMTGITIFGAQGTVYKGEEDIYGPIDPDRYIVVTDLWVDDLVRNWMDEKMVGKTGGYRLINNSCRTFSQGQFDEILLFIAQRGLGNTTKPPTREPRAPEPLPLSLPGCTIGVTKCTRIPTRAISEPLTTLSERKMANR